MLTSSRIYRSIAISVLFALFTNKSACQEYIDLVKTKYSISPSNQFEGSPEKSTLKQFSGDLTLPIQLTDRFTLLTGVAGEYITATFNTGQRNTFVSSISLKAGANVTFSNKWSGTFVALPKIASDMQQISSDDLQIGGVALLKHKVSSRANYKFGIYANRECFGTMLVPMAGFYYLNRTKRFEVNVLLPLSADLNYQFSKRMKAGVHFKGEVRSYNLTSKGTTTQDRYLSRSTNELTTYLNYEFENGINCKVGVGHSFARSFRMYDDEVAMALPLIYFGDERKQLNHDFADGWIVQASVYYRFHFDKK